MVSLMGDEDLVSDKPDFSEYMWMENEEDFDKNEMQRLEEEHTMKECYEAMIEDEVEEQLKEWQKVKTEQLNNALSALPASACNVEKSVLNPLADEFIPRQQVVNMDTS